MSSTVDWYLREHPFLSFFIATSAISGVATVAGAGLQKADVAKFVDDHPILTTLIAFAAIDGIVTIVRGRTGRDACMEDVLSLPPLVSIRKGVTPCPPGYLGGSLPIGTIPPEFWRRTAAETGMPIPEFAREYAYSDLPGAHVSHGWHSFPGC